ncbi:hypothetical protein [Actinomadura sp. WAC 06369]|uniref:hypothetical protein n=1 Tax=Actinomadura sp. WAC 06369 TaxID=2203193 RepID=UPI000F79D6F5|nr:hypothetical protein [Actinomadura sp. WAC 06369]
MPVPTPPAPETHRGAPPIRRAFSGRTRCAFACWFDTAGPISRPTPGGDRAWIAAARRASREYRYDHTRFVL